uniref:Coiled-coil-helix-coiled-coil-helix domain containing 3a n=1 Tax=Esox lucius TaxID=8010 RepID=A0A6Q2Z4F4_ESOLU
MGGNSSSHVPFADEDNHVSFVKGIRLTDKVINRMREERQATKKIVHPRSQQNGPAPQLSTEAIAPTITPAPTVDHLVPHLVDPPHSAQPSSLPLPVQPVKLTPPPPVTFVAAPPAKPMVQASAVDSEAPPPPLKPMVQPPTVESAAPPSPAKYMAQAPGVESTPPPPPVKPMTQAPAVESAAPPLPEEPVVLATPLVSPVEPEVAATPSTTSVETKVLPQVAKPIALSPSAEAKVISTPPPPSAETVVPPPPFVDATVLSSVDEPVVLATPVLVDKVFMPTPVEPTVPTSVVAAAVVEPDVFPTPPPVVPPLKVAPPPADDVLPKPPPVEPLTVYSAPIPVAPNLPAPVVEHTSEPIVENLQAPTWQSMELATHASTSMANEQADLPPPPCAEPTDPPPPPGSEEPTVTVPLPLLDEDVAFPTVAPVTAPAVPAPPSVVVDEEELRRQIRAELTKDLEEEMKRKRQELQKQLDEVKAAARVQAQAAAQLRVQEEVQKIHSLEKAAQSDIMKAAIAKERMTKEEETLMAQLYAHKLEEKEKQLKKQDLIYREQIARLEEKSARFFKVTTENFKKGREDVHNTFKHVDIRPVCGDLQTHVQRCYRENRGQTLACSGLASLYMQCVEGHKKVSLYGCFLTERETLRLTVKHAYTEM